MINKEENNTILTIIAIIIIYLIIEPFLIFWISYFVGWLSKIFIGKYIVAAFELLHISFPADKIPLLAGLLGWIGSFFKSTINTNKN